MSTIGELAVNVVARTGGLQSGMSKAQRQLANFQKSALSTAATVAGAFIGGMGIRALVNDFAELGDTFDKMSQRVGVSVEALSALKFAAEQSGTDLNTVEVALRGMARVLLDAEQGLSTAQRTFEMLGLSSQALAAQSPEQQFISIAQAISEIDDPSRQAALALEVFGRSGTQLLPMLRNGKAGIEELMAEAERLGIVMSEDDAKAAAEFNDAMNRLRRTVQGFMNEVLGQLIPVVTNLVNWWNNLSDTAKGAAGTITAITLAFGATILVLPKVVAGVQAVIAIYNALIAKQILLQALSGPKGWIALAAGVAVATGAVALLNSALDDTGKSLKKVTSGRAIFNPSIRSSPIAGGGTIPVRIVGGNKDNRDVVDALDKQNGILSSLRTDVQDVDRIGLAASF